MGRNRSRNWIEWSVPEFTRHKHTFILEVYCSTEADKYVSGSTLSLATSVSMNTEF